MNWYAGWSLILTAFVTGAMLGLFFHQDKFLGGYQSLRRRLLRLGHIALAALGMLNVLYELSTAMIVEKTSVASAGLIVGGITMPMVCFLSAWRIGFRHLFFVPVSALIAAVVEILWVGRL